MYAERPKKRLVGIAAIALFGGWLSACTIVREDNGGGAGGAASQNKNSEENAASVDEYLMGLDRLEVAQAAPKAEVECDGNCPPDEQDGDFFCTYSRYSETVRFDRFVAFQPNSATLWPGVVIHGKDAQYGQLNPLAVDLAPVTFSLSLENLNASPVGYMDEPSLSAFREVRNEILAADVSGATPAAIDFEIRFPASRNANRFVTTASGRVVPERLTGSVTLASP